MKQLLILTIISISFLIPACGGGGGGGGSSDSTGATNQSSSTDEYPVIGDTEGFRDWFKFNEEPVNGVTHGETNIYINKLEEEVVVNGVLVNPLPEGSLIVKEILSSGVLALMKKVKDTDPDHGDWLFIEYSASGSLIAKDSSCWGCHISTKDTDYVFTKVD